MRHFLMLISLISVLSACQRPEKPATVLKTSGDIKFDSIAPNVWIHRSYLNTESFGKVECNGLIYVDDKDAVIIDTPVDDSTSQELINWVSQKLNAKIKALVTTHFHEDCIGGINIFHANKIPSYAYHKTIELAKEKGITPPKTGFQQELIIHLEDNYIQCSYLGAGHTQDNIVVYLPNEKVLFGGCLIKELNANKGYLGDADTLAWSSTIRKVKEQFPDANIIVPGHGQHGDRSLLDYTEKLFEQKK